MNDEYFEIVELPLKVQRTVPIDENDYSLPYNPPEYVKDPLGFIDADIISKIKNQFYTNDLERYTESYYANDIEYFSKIMGSCCQYEWLNEIIKYVKKLHDNFNKKDPAIVKNWLSFIRSLHPMISDKIDDLLENGDELGWKPYYFRNVSEQCGNNTILYLPDEHNIDLTDWGNQPNMFDNNIKWTTSTWSNIPSFIRETTRQKIDPQITTLINSNCFTTQKLLRRNVIFDAIYTTAKTNGRLLTQIRPIPYTEAHGASLNQDHYHFEERICGEDGNKFCGRQDLIYYLDDIHPDSYFVHLMINHLTPLLDEKIAPLDKLIALKNPIGIEETFPCEDTTINTRSVLLQNNGQPYALSYSEVNDDVLKPLTQQDIDKETL